MDDDRRPGRCDECGGDNAEAWAMAARIGPDSLDLTGRWCAACAASLARMRDFPMACWIACKMSEVAAQWRTLAEHRGRRVERAEAEVERLKRQVEGHCRRIAEQSELLSRRAERHG